MGDAWELFQGWWRVKNDDSPITDASSADDSIIEDAITRFQEVSKEMTDMLAQLSSARSSGDSGLYKMTEAVTLALSYAREGKSSEVVKVLEKALDR